MYKVLCLQLIYVITLLHKRRELVKKKNDNKTKSYFCYTNCEWMNDWGNKWREKAGKRQRMFINQKLIYQIIDVFSISLNLIRFYYIHTSAILSSAPHASSET